MKCCNEKQRNHYSNSKCRKILLLSCIYIAPILKNKYGMNLILSSDLGYVSNILTLPFIICVDK